jgi:hypothetical protein
LSAGAIGRRVDREAVIDEQLLQTDPDRLLVLDDQEAGLAEQEGRVARRLPKFDVIG